MPNFFPAPNPKLFNADLTLTPSYTPEYTSMSIVSRFTLLNEDCSQCLFPIRVSNVTFAKEFYAICRWCDTDDATYHLFPSDTSITTKYDLTQEEVDSFDFNNQEGLKLMHVSCPNYMQSGNWYVPNFINVKPTIGYGYAWNASNKSLNVFVHGVSPKKVLWCNGYQYLGGKRYNKSVSITNNLTGKTFNFTFPYSVDLPQFNSSESALHKYYCLADFTK